MPRALPPCPTPEQLQRAYEACALGTEPPNRGATTGRVLNQLLGTDEYLPDQVYVVCTDGIYEYHEG